MSKRKIKQVACGVMMGAIIGGAVGGFFRCLPRMGSCGLERTLRDKADAALKLLDRAERFLSRL